MNDLPDLPFKRILSYLSLKDVIKSRAVSRSFYHKINSFKVRCLCMSGRPSGLIYGKNHWVSGAFAENFIISHRFLSFFTTFGQTILSNLKHLRLCDLYPGQEKQAAFARSLQWFSQLEHLDIIRVGFLLEGSKNRDAKTEIELSLPMLHSIHLKGVHKNVRLRLDAPRLKRIKIQECTELILDLVHAESVERLLSDRLEYTEVKNLKNLKYIYIFYCSSVQPTLLCSLEGLKEVHLISEVKSSLISELFQQMQRSRRTELKVYVYGLLLNSPDDLEISSLNFYFSPRVLHCVENTSKLAGEIPFRKFLNYTEIEQVAPGSESSLMKRYTDLDQIIIGQAVQNTQRFLELLKSFDNISNLVFHCEQPQELFDRLPEYSAVQRLSLYFPVPDFLWFRLKNLLYLYLHCPIDAETVQKLFEELPLLKSLSSKVGNKPVLITIGYRNRFNVIFDQKYERFDDLNAMMQFLFGYVPPKRRAKKRKAAEPLQ